MQVRAKTPDGKEVVGYAFESEGDWYIITTEATVRWVEDHYEMNGIEEIVRETAAIDTGKLDKHGERIFGSKGEMQGGDTVRIHGHGTSRYKAVWHDLSWGLYNKKDGFYSLYVWNCDELEIIKAEKGGE
jgi:hypothetical protein